MIESGLNALLLELYSCPGDGALWPRLMDQIRRLLQVRCAAIQLLTRSNDGVTVKWVARDSESEADAGHHDPFISGDQNPRLRYRPPFERWAAEGFVRDRDYSAQAQGELAQLRLRLADLGLGSHLSKMVPLSEHERLILVLHRDLDDRREYSREEEEFVAAVLPHLRQAVVLAGQLEETRYHNECLRETINRMSLGLILCDADARPFWLNHAARQICSSREGLWLNHDQLTSRSPADTAALRRAIAQTAREGTNAPGTRDGCLLLGGSVKGPALQIMVIALGRTDDFGRHCGYVRSDRGQVLLLCSRQTTTQMLSPEAVGKLFALSPAESRLTVALCQGQTVNDYAVASGISVGTARFQLKQVLAKTQAPRQSELVRRIYTSVVTHAMRAEA